MKNKGAKVGTLLLSFEMIYVSIKHGGLEGTEEHRDKKSL